ncbi:hypothetical protein DZK27_11720 [Rhodobacteraceae bacterium 63075]|nr:hypothetical protein DZK27_11720 [Rhodobacteraceae bacterium 63075]
MDIEMTVSPLRRGVGAGAVLLSGALLLGTALWDAPQSLLAQGLILLLGAALIWSGVRLWRDTEVSVRLVEDRLEESTGELIVTLDQVEEVVRGHLAFRPSNGFSLKLREEAEPRWRMGLWWRAGKRAAFGGAASSVQTRQLADALEKRLGQERQD